MCSLSFRRNWIKTLWAVLGWLLDIWIVKLCIESMQIGNPCWWIVSNIHKLFQVGWHCRGSEPSNMNLKDLIDYTTLHLWGSVDEAQIWCRLELKCLGIFLPGFFYNINSNCLTWKRCRMMDLNGCTSSKDSVAPITPGTMICNCADIMTPNPREMVDSSVKVILSFWREFPVPTMLNPLLNTYLDGNQFQVGVVIEARRKINAPQRSIGAPQRWTDAPLRWIDAPQRLIRAPPRWIHRNWVSQTIISSQVTAPYLIVRLTSSPFKTVDKQWLWSCFMTLVGYNMSTGNDTSCIVF